MSDFTNASRGELDVVHGPFINVGLGLECAAQTGGVVVNFMLALCMHYILRPR